MKKEIKENWEKKFDKLWKKIEGMCFECESVLSKAMSDEFKSFIRELLKIKNK